MRTLIATTVAAILSTGAAAAPTEGSGPQVPAPLPEDSGSTIGYPTVAAALSDLKARRDVKFSTQNGWLVATDPSGPTVWLFLPRGDPAYPSVFRRGFENRPDGGTGMATALRCEASNAACDDLARKYLGGGR